MAVWLSIRWRWMICLNMLHVKNLVLRRGKDPETFELRISDLKLMKGEVVALHGSSGIGKSTCLELLAGVVRPDQAEKFIITESDKEDIDLTCPNLDTAPLRAGPIGFAPQSGGLLGFLNGRANARAAIDLSGLNGHPLIEKRFDRIVNDLALEDCLAKSRSALSGGQRKRISLLRAIAVPRRLLLLDEPTAGLDNCLANRVISCIMRICREDETICIAAMHDLGRAKKYNMVSIQILQKPGGAILSPPVGK
jgi:putative ABC transport system ATP-binding protein